MKKLYIPTKKTVIELKEQFDKAVEPPKKSILSLFSAATQYETYFGNFSKNRFWLSYSKPNQLTSSTLKVMKGEIIKTTPFVMVLIIRDFMKGIILAGGFGSRLYPLTLIQSKQLLPVYNKPMIYYPLSTLISCGIREILIITNKEYIGAYKTLLGNGDDFGINITYAIQEKPLGIAQALQIARDYIFDECCTLILGDNIFIGSNVVENLKQAFLSAYSGKASLFLKNVEKPTSFGVATLDIDGNITEIEEKPQITNSNWAVTGLYVYPKGAVKYVNDLIPSSRGELEITDLNRVYLNDGKVIGYTLADDVVWFDAGTTDNLLDASIYIRQQEEETGEMIGCPEVCAIRNRWLDTNELDKALEKYKNDKRVETLRHTFMANLKNV